jgi:LETM1 and EF-hand domain-containing protein 1
MIRAFTYTHRLSNVGLRGFATKPPDPPPQSMGQRVVGWIKHEGKKVINGCKLLYRDAKFMTSKKYNITFHGADYNLKERKLMERTTADLLKMVPFSIFIIIPGLELLLPPLVYIFPNMIPSTFMSKKLMEEKRASREKRRPIYADRVHAVLMEKVRALDEDSDDLLKRIRNSP